NKFMVLLTNQETVQILLISTRWQAPAQKKPSTVSTQFTQDVKRGQVQECAKMVKMIIKGGATVDSNS
ncbi:unnamed protein product, partial [Candidula unifasciata]